MNKLLFFSAPWCSQCKGFKPRFEATIKGMNIDCIHINVDTAGEDYLQKYNIKNLPTLIYVDKDGKELERGNHINFNEFLEKIKKYV